MENCARSVVRVCWNICRLAQIALKIGHPYTLLGLAWVTPKMSSGKEEQTC